MISALSLFPGENLSQPDTYFIKDRAQQFYDRASYDSASYYYLYLSRVIDIDADPELYCHARNNLALCYLWMDKPEECVVLAYQNIHDCEEKLGSANFETALAYMNYGAYKYVYGPSQVAPKYFLNAAFILVDNFGENNAAVAKCYEWLGSYYESENDRQTSWHYLSEALKLWKSLKGENHPDLAELYRYIGLYYKRYSQHDSAILFLTKAKTLFDRKLGNSNFQSVKCLNNLATIYAEHKSLECKVLPTFEQCERLIQSMISPNRMATSMTLFNKANYLRGKGEYEDALKLINRILSLYYDDFDCENVWSNPADPSRQPYYIPEITLFFKAAVLMEWMECNPDLEYSCLISANDCYARVDMLLDAVKTKITNLDNQFHFTDRVSQHYDNSVLNSIMLYKRTNNLNYIDQAIGFLTKKSMAIDSFKVSSWATKPENTNLSVWEQKSELQKKLNELVSINVKSEESVLKMRSFIKKSIELDLIHDPIQKSEPESFRKSRSTDINLKTIRQKLSPDECIIIFLESKAKYMGFPELLISLAITTDTIIPGYQQDSKAFELAAQYLDMLIGDSQNDSVNVLGLELYKSLFSGLEPVMNQKLILIPSAHLSLIPFDALPSKSTNFHNNCRLMIEDHLIWKAFSIQSFLKDQNNDNQFISDSLLVLAPFFNKDKVHEILLLTKRDSSLINLPGASKESYLIAKHFKTLSFTGYEATKKSFVDNVNRFPYIHISTHGAPMNSIKEYVSLAFSDDNDDGWLNFYDILNLQLNAELIVLSACKTGIGAMNNGEGNLNLAWAFNQAGARSVVIGLWDVSDYASSQIMPDFYKFLREGFSKPEALRLAKLAFIRNHDQTVGAPYYWAAFDFVGNGDVISSDSLSPFEKFGRFSIYALCGVGLLLVLIFCFKKLLPGVT